MSPRLLIASAALFIGVFGSWLLLKDPPSSNDSKPVAKKVVHKASPVAPPPKSERDLTSFSAREISEALGAIPNERIVRFKDEKSYRDFLAKLGSSSVRNLSQIDGLRAVRVGFDSLTDLNALDLDPDNLNYNFPVYVPRLREIEPQDGVVGFGNNALAFLGITEDNSNWGTGVKIAVIDTGIEPHLALRDDIQRINLVELGEGAEPHGHGTAVASLIAGTHPNMRGVAPGADLISVRVADESGSSDSFTLADGILAAAEAGADLINISLGSDFDSPLVREAIDVAVSRGAVIFASSGNDGGSNSSFPGGNEKVYSVGAVDASGQYLNFSNRDQDLAFSAPGLEVQAAALGDNVTEFTGTSGAVAFPVGAVAAIMSESSSPISAQDATDILYNTSNEAGEPGGDPQYGQGILNVGRAMQRDTPGIEDLAVASQTYLLPTAEDPSSGLLVSVENRGTETVYGSVVRVGVDGGEFPMTISSLRPNERRVLTIPAGFNILQDQGFLDVRSEVIVSDSTNDVEPSNNIRAERILLPGDDQ